MKSQFERIEDSALRVHNAIQMDLVRMDAEKSKVTPEEFDAWIQKYSAKFRELMSARPDLLSLYVEDREKALGEIEKVLYAETQ